MPVTATAYTYNELSDNAKKKAIEESRYCCVESSDWWDYTFDWYKDEILLDQGFEVSKRNKGEVDALYFSGFSSQGDGASFAAGVDVRQFLKANKLSNEFRSLYYWSGPDFGYADVNVYIQNSHYCHEMTMNIEVEWTGDWDENAENVPAVDQLDELESVILDKAREMARKLYRSLEDEYNAMTSDEYVADHIQANEYLYWSNGHPALFP